MIPHRRNNQRSTIDTKPKPAAKPVLPPLSPSSPRSTMHVSPPPSPIRRAKSLPESLKKNDNGKPLFWFRPAKATRSSPTLHPRNSTSPSVPLAYRPPTQKKSFSPKDLSVPILYEQPVRSTDATVSTSQSMDEDDFTLSSMEEDDLNESSLRGLCFIEDERRE